MNKMLLYKKNELKKVIKNNNNNLSNMPIAKKTNNESNLSSNIYQSNST
jgi:hypothetical protein